MADRTPDDRRAMHPVPAIDEGDSPAPGSEAQPVPERIHAERTPKLPTLLAVATLGDERARARDLAASMRDRAADARDRAIARADATEARRDTIHSIGGPQLAAAAAGQRERATAHRLQAAEQRLVAAAERRAAARDREAAARERGRALAIRETLLAEIQEQYALRDEAQSHARRAEELARALQRSLSPPRLPSIAGIDVAVHYEPAAPERVGGDFYDLFPLARGRSAFFLGDVGGKGPEAAAVTSLARYTMRTAAMLRERPEAILMDLNTALRMDSEQPMKTCTVVYGQLDIDGDATIALGVAGHPPPLVVRAHGAVEVMPARGTLLGVFSDPVFEGCSISLGAGDAIVIYSDGLIDTEIDGMPLDESVVARLLAGTAHASAQALVARLADAVRGNDRPLRDDVAILALRRTPSAHP